MPSEVYIPVMAYSIWLGLAGVFIVAGLRGTIAQYRAWRVGKMMKEAQWKHCSQDDCKAKGQDIHTKWQLCRHCKTLLLVSNQDCDNAVAEAWDALETAGFRYDGAAIEFTRPEVLACMDLRSRYPETVEEEQKL